MPNPKNAMEVFTHLNKSNCRDCGEKTCLAFAGAVYQGRKQINQCPHLDPEIVKKYATENVMPPRPTSPAGGSFVDDVETAVSSLDFREAAERCGGKYDGTTLRIKVLGKDFGIRPDGKFITDIHVNTWITGPLLDHLILGKGKEPEGEWISFREVKGSDDLRYSFFKRRCEAGLKRVADTYTDLFDDLVHIFGGKRVERHFQADISVALPLFPKVPLLICYMEPEEGMPSTLNLFFDRSVNENLSIDSALTLGAGFALMIEKITEKHGFLAV